MKVAYIQLIIWFLFAVTPVFSQQSSSWNDTQKNKTGSITIYWFDSEPFIFNDAKGNLTGIEHGIMQGFVQYLKQTHDIELTINWKRAKSFPDVINVVKRETQFGIFGSSALSITEGRKKIVGFSSPYLEDITIIISHQNVPIVKDEHEFKEVFSGLTAITIDETSFEKDLFDIQERLDMDFEMEYIGSDQNILNTIAVRENTFGYTDLSIYLTKIKNNPSLHVVRQSLFPIKQKGYGFIMSKNSDWIEPFNRYLNSTYFNGIAPAIISEYIESDLYSLIKRISSGESVNPDEEILLLTKEKEIQYKELFDAALRQQKNNWIMYVSLGGLIVAVLVIIVLYLFYKSKVRSNKILSALKDQIDSQRKNIQKQSEALAMRNNELLSLNDEKNNLIHVLAHDLRTPINQITGLAHLYTMEHKQLGESELYTFNTILGCTNRLNEMISKILDVEAIESNSLNVKQNKIDVNEVIEDVLQTYQEAATKKSITLNYTETPGVIIVGDRIYLRQILDNLVSNAVKFSYPGTIVSVNLASESGQVKVEVTDQGPGFTIQDKQKVFGKFQRLSAQPTGGEQSTGLGLSIVKKYVELQHGEIMIDSHIGKGTTFTILFPQAT